MRSQLTRIASRVAAIAADADAAHTADTTGAAVEQIDRHARAHTDLVLEIHGWTADEFEDELTARTSPRWVFMSGLTRYTRPAARTLTPAF